MLDYSARTPIKSGIGPDGSDLQITVPSPSCVHHMSTSEGSVGTLHRESFEDERPPSSHSWLDVSDKAVKSRDDRAPNPQVSESQSVHSLLPLKRREKASPRYRRLDDNNKLFLVSWIVNIALVILPLLFMIFALIAARINEQSLSPQLGWILSISQIGPTVYPIMFAAIVGRLMNDIALYIAERGARLGTIEHLVQSSSLASTLKSALFVRNRTPGTLLVVLIWCLSPIGGQSALRLVSEGDSLLTTNQTLYYGMGAAFTLGENEMILDNMRNYLQASLRAPLRTKSSLIDPWQNAKVPALNHSLLSDLNSSVEDPNNWLEFDPTSSDNYTALVGIPLWGVPLTGNTSFTIPWSYMYTDCQQKPGQWNKVCPKKSSSLPSFCTDMSQGGTLRNGTVWKIEWNNKLLNASDAPEYVQLQVWTQCGDYAQSRGSLSVSSSCASMFLCDLKSIHIDVNITCIDGLCGSVAFRKSVTDVRPDFLTPWNEWLPITSGLRNEYVIMLDNFIDMSSDVFGSDSTGTGLVDSFLAGSTRTDISVNNANDISNTSEPVFSLRTTQLFNTYWQIAQYGDNIAIEDEDNPPTEVDNDNNTVALSGYAKVEAEVRTSSRVYKVHDVWVILLTYISFSLVVCSVASMIMQAIILSPNILGHVSSLTRDNAYFESLELESTLDGPNRAHLLQDLRVSIADVRPHHDIGKIAFISSSRNSDSANVVYSRLKRGRLYE